MEKRIGINKLNVINKSLNYDKEIDVGSPPKIGVNISSNRRKEMEKKITVKELHDKIVATKDEMKRRRVEINLAEERISVLLAEYSKIEKLMDSKIAFAIENTILSRKQRFTQEEIIIEIYEKFGTEKETIKYFVKEIISSYLDDCILSYKMDNERNEGFILN